MKHSERLDLLRQRLQQREQLSEDENTDLLKAVAVIRKVEDGKGFSATPVVGALDGRPRVDVGFMGQLANVPVDMVRSMAGELVKAAANAENEAILIRFLRHECEISGDPADVLRKFREYRDRPNDNHSSMLVSPFSNS